MPRLLSPVVYVPTYRKRSPLAPPPPALAPLRMVRRPRAPAAAAERKLRRDSAFSSVTCAPRGRRGAERRRAARRRRGGRLPDAERGVEHRALHGVGDRAAERADARGVARRVHAVGEE